MSLESNILLIFDLKAILASRTRDWSLFEEFGTCFIPQVVREEIEFLCKRSSNPEEEKTAREFTRFLSNSNWQISQVFAKHPFLNAADDQNLSKNARLQQAFAESVYGLSQENPNQLIVLISNQQNLRNDIDKLKIDNLCTLTLAQFIQWLRTKQRPINVSQKISKMKNKGVSNNKFYTKKSVSDINKNSQITSYPKSSKLQNNAQTIKAKVLQKSNFISTIISSILTLIGFSFVALILWYFIQPNSFNEFWQKTGLPPLPNNSSNK